MNKKIAQGFSIAGMTLLQASAIPAIIEAIKTGQAAPLNTLVLIALGLLCCVVTETYYKLWAYVIGSSVSAIAHITIIIIVLCK